MALLFAVWPWSSGKEFNMTADPKVPAATGAVKVESDKDEPNLKLDIKVRHLAHPSNLTPSENTYVVWLQPSGAEPAKQGAIRVDKNLEGELKALTTARTFDLFITAEQSEGVASPTGAKVLSAHVSP